MTDDMIDKLQELVWEWENALAETRAMYPDREAVSTPTAAVTAMDLLSAHILQVGAILGMCPICGLREGAHKFSCPEGERFKNKLTFRATLKKDQP